MSWDVEVTGRAKKQTEKLPNEFVEIHLRGIPSDKAELVKEAIEKILDLAFSFIGILSFAHYYDKNVSSSRKYTKTCSTIISMSYGENMIKEKIQRNVFEVANLHDPDDLSYWRDRSYVERIETIEFMRKAMFGHDRVSERLQRVLTIAELKEN